VGVHQKSVKHAEAERRKMVAGRVAEGVAERVAGRVAGRVGEREGEKVEERVAEMASGSPREGRRKIVQLYLD
jgi:hypothetical protein